jgi:hypothetical protein
MNVVFTLGLWGIELLVTSENEDELTTTKWKVE